MKTRDVVDLLLLAALWGASFLFIRLGAAEFGPVPLAALRCVGAALFLLPILLMRGHGAALRTRWPAIAWVGVVNSALPFSLYGVALLAINAGLSAIFNAATPLWAAAIGAVWLRERLGASRVLGLCIGLAGVAGLAWNKAGFTVNEHGVSAALAIAACLLATALYGYGGNFTKKHLSGVPPMALATGSQLGAAVVLAVPAWLQRPAVMPSATAWVSLALLAILCTGVAYILYFRLIVRTGPTNAAAVTFLIPVFAALFGWLFLDEAVTLSMLIGGAVILVGTALAMGLVPRATPLAQRA